MLLANRNNLCNLLLIIRNNRLKIYKYINLLLLEAPTTYRIFYDTEYNSPLVLTYN